MIIKFMNGNNRTAMDLSLLCDVYLIFYPNIFKKGGKKMSNKILIAIMGTLLTVSVAGCGDTLNNNQLDTQSDYKMTHANRSLSTPFVDMFYGFKMLNKFITHEDYASAKTLSRNLDDEFHDAILPSLIAKKGKSFASGIDAKYDELTEAISQKNKPQIRKLIVENRNNLKTIAPMMGVSVLSSE
jgi:hypothetical protein